jgi:diguanylate cyclase (GGDEF)-like protein
VSRIAEHLAELTGFRDRELLDVSLVGALKDLVHPLALAIYRVVGEPGQQHWITRARLGPGETTPSADSLWAELESLPALAAKPEHAHCLSGGQVLAMPGPPAMTLFPLATERETVGVLEITTAAPLDDERRRLVDSILRIYRNFQGLLDYSERDTLTGLLNRKTFDECFLRMALPAGASAGAGGDGSRRSGQAGRAFLGVIDIDHFKRVNDSFGHLIGDEVLLLMSRLMRASFRHHDHLFRFGGEEFVVLMRCGRADDAATAFERLRANVEGYGFPRVGRITVSAGFTELRGGDTPTGCFERADKAVYHAKQNGRNQVHDHAALVSRGVLDDESRASDVELF